MTCLNVTQKYRQVSGLLLPKQTAQLRAAVFRLRRIEEREYGANHKAFIEGGAWRRPFFERRRLRRKYIAMFADLRLGRRAGFCQKRQYLCRCHPQRTQGATVTDDAV